MPLVLIFFAMITGALAPSSTQQLAALGKMLERYVEVSGKTTREVLEQKGRDLGIKLYQGFRSHRWGAQSGSRGRGESGIAWKEFRARVSAGRGIRVSPKTNVEEWAARAPATQQRHFELRDTRGALRRSSLETSRPLTQRQRAVWAELARRQAGIGALAASFLWFRRRKSNARGTYYVRNKAGAPIGFVESTATFLHIGGLTPGLARVDARYGIVAKAVTRVMADTGIYLVRKLNLDAVALARSLGLPAAA